MKEHILQIGKDSSWYLAAQISLAVIGFLSVPIFTHIFNPGDYGIYSLVSTAVGFAAPLFFIWLTTSIIRFYPECEREDRVDILYSTAFHFAPHFLVIFLGFAVAMGAFVIPLGKYRLVICLGIAVFALTTFSQVCLDLMRARQMSWQYALFFTFIAAGRYLIGAGLAAWFHLGVAGVFWAWLGALVLAVPVELLALRARKYFSWGRYSRELNREFLSFGFVLIFVNVFANVLTVADRYVLQIFKGSSQVGLYSVVYTLVLSLTGVIGGFIILGTVPVVMKVYEGEGEERARHLIGRITRYVLMILLPSLFALWVLRVRVMTVITAPKYLPAAKVVLPLVIGNLLFYMIWLPALAFEVKKRTKLAMVSAGISAAFNIILNVALVPRFGYPGAAWATAASYVLYLVLVILISRPLMKWEFPWWDAVKIAVASGVTVAALYGLNRLHMKGLLALVSIIVIGALIYFVCLFAERAFTQNEMEFVRSIFKRERP